MASLTYQHLFMMFPKMAGMSGTLADASEELMDIYKKEVLVIPPNRPMKRADLPDLYFRNAESQFQAAVETALEVYRIGRPVLIVVTTIAETELVSRLLMEENVPHSVLNATSAFWEAEMIREAGQMNALTISTSMAGRGTDIRLGDGVKKIGGLAVIGIGRMVNVRQERQARGRAGRQGDPGTSQFFVSLEDDIIARNKALKFEKYIEGRKRISRRKLKRTIDKVQALGEEFAVMGRRRSVAYDDVMHWQREIMYDTRNQLLDGRSLPMSTVMKIAKDNIHSFLKSQRTMDSHTINRYILDNISYMLDEKSEINSLKDPAAVESYLLQKVADGLEEQEEKLGGRENMSAFVRAAVLSALDNAWVEQVDYLQQLQAAVSGRSMAQRNPVFEYQKEALKSFREMERTAKKDMIRNILLSDVFTDEEGELHIIFP